MLRFCVAVVMSLFILNIFTPLAQAQPHTGPRVRDLYGCDFVPQVHVSSNELLHQPPKYIRFSWATIADESGMFLMANLIDWTREELADGRGLRLMHGTRASVTHWNCGGSERRALVEYIEAARHLSGKKIYVYPHAFTPGVMWEGYNWPVPFNCAASQTPFPNDHDFGGWMYVAAPYAIVRYTTGVASQPFYWTIVEGHRWIYLLENIQRRHVSFIMCDPFVEHTQLVPTAQGTDIFTPDPSGFVLSNNIMYIPTAQR